MSDQPFALLSWRVIAEIAMSPHPKWLAWLTDRQRNSKVLVAQYSLMKASGFIRKRSGEASVNLDGMFDRFIRRYILDHSVIDAWSISSDLYNQLSTKLGNDDLELFAICLALQNEYVYLCWDEAELRLANELAPKLASTTFEAFLDGV